MLVERLIRSRSFKKTLIKYLPDTHSQPLRVGRDAEGAFVRAEAAAVGEDVVLRALRRRTGACEQRAAGTVCVCRVEGYPGNAPG